MSGVTKSVKRTEPQELVIANAKIVLVDEIIDGTIKIVDGGIEDISPGGGTPVHAVDCDGDYLIPGLIDVHTDNLEKHLEPRPGVRWPILPALFSHDRLIIGCGITTVYDALCIGDFTGNKRGRRQALELALQGLHQAAETDVLAAKHLLHLRCEVPTANVVEALENHIHDPFVGMVSVMDHTPGQRQWHDLERWREFNRDRYTPAELDQILAGRIAFQNAEAENNRERVIDLAKAHGLPLASHDDTTVAHAEEAAAAGVGIAEFPTTIAAARAARGAGMATIMGGPNVVKGGSHSGNVSAAALAEAGLLDGLASDYVPASMIHGAFFLHAEYGLALVDAIALVTANPAAMVGLDDRGAIAVGKRADLVRIRVCHGVPAVVDVWRGGHKVA